MIQALSIFGGYSLISILDPADLDPDRRVVRGNDVSVNLSIIDNAGPIGRRCRNRYSS